MPASFFNTNVVLYLASADAAKAARVERLIGDGGIISVQVLNESANVLRGKHAAAWSDITAFLAALRLLLEVHPLTVEIHEAGLGLAERYGFATYDALIVAAALAAGCETLWTEDMQHGLVVERRLRLLNPFRM